MSAPELTDEGPGSGLGASGRASEGSSSDIFGRGWSLAWWASPYSKQQMISLVDDVTQRLQTATWTCVILCVANQCELHIAYYKHIVYINEIGFIPRVIVEDVRVAYRRRVYYFLLVVFLNA
jgi:hypothetical protein